MSQSKKSSKTLSDSGSVICLLASGTPAQVNPRLAQLGISRLFSFTNLYGVMDDTSKQILNVESRN